MRGIEKVRAEMSTPSSRGWVSVLAYNINDDSAPVVGAPGANALEPPVLMCRVLVYLLFGETFGKPNLNK